MSCMSVVLIVISLVVRHLHNRERSSSGVVVQRHQGFGVDSCVQLQQTNPHNNQDEKDKGDSNNNTGEGHGASDLELAKSMGFVSTLSPVSSSSDSTTTMAPKEFRHHQKEVLSPTDSVDIEMETRPSRIV